MKPQLLFRPLRPAVAADGPTELDLVLSVRVPGLPPAHHRTALNLALVIDCSASMAGSKLSHARKAARFLAGALSSRDRLAIVAFDQEAAVLVPSQHVRDPHPFIGAINSLSPGSGTAIFDGWLAGATEVAEHFDAQGLNRVLLLSDGQATSGLQDADAIAEVVTGLTQRGVGTTAIGLGAGFDEDLMAAVAAAGGGTLGFIESQQHLVEFCTSEVIGLLQIAAHGLTFQLCPMDGVELLEILNDLPKCGEAEYQLPNLRYGQEFVVGLRLRLPAWSPNRDIARVTLEWQTPGGQRAERLTRELTLPVKPQGEVQKLAADEFVAEQMALLAANRERRRAIELHDIGDFTSVLRCLESIDELLASAPQTEAVCRERRLMEGHQKLIRADRNLSRKRLRSESLRSSLSIWESGGGHG